MFIFFSCLLIKRCYEDTTTADRSPPSRHPQQLHRATATPDRHTLDRFRARRGHTLAPSGTPHALSRAPRCPAGHPRPVWYASRLEPCAPVSSRTPSPPGVRVHIVR